MRSNPICGVIPPNRRQIAILARNRQPKFLSSQAVIVPGRVFGWVLSQDQPESGELAPEIKECLRDTSNKQGGPEAQEDPKPKGGPNTKGVPKSKRGPKSKGGPKPKEDPKPKRGPKSKEDPKPKGGPKPKRGLKPKGPKRRKKKKA